MPYTITLGVDRLWLTLATDPTGDALVCGTNQTTAGSYSLAVELDHFAAGRIQASVFDQDDASYPYTLRLLTFDQFSKLLAWRGKVVLLRTYEGVRDFVVYGTVAWRRVLHLSQDGDQLYKFDADVIFQRVTYGEAV